MIYSPNVPFFRDDNCNLLKDPYTFTILSASAVNSKYYLRRHSGQDRQWIGDAKKILKDTMRYRIDKILDIAVKNKHDGIILGSFGCGVFGNDPNVVSDCFAQLLATKYYKRFKFIKFAVLEFSKKERIFDSFHYSVKRRFSL